MEPSAINEAKLELVNNIVSEGRSRRECAKESYSKGQDKYSDNQGNREEDGSALLQTDFINYLS